MTLSLTSFIPGLSEVKLIALAVAAAGTIGATSCATYNITHGRDAKKYDALVQADKAAQEAAVSTARTIDAKEASLALASAVSEAQAQTQIVTRTITLTKEIPTYVTQTETIAAAVGSPAGCVPFGLVRVLDAAVLDVDPASLALPTGQSDDTCSPVSATALAEGIVSNYGVAQQNADQLDQLVGIAEAQDKALVSP